MAENDILGISAHLDFDDIQKSIDQLINGLDKIGLKTDILSKRMNDAMNEIARSTDDTATKNKKAMDVFAQGIAEAKVALEKYPEALRQAKNEEESTALATARLEAELKKLNAEFLNSNIGSEKYERLKTSIAGVEQQITSNNLAHERQLQTIQEMEAGYSQLVAMYGVGSAAIGTNAIAHATVAVATGTEAAAHLDNAEKIEKETKAVLESKSAKDFQEEGERKITEAIHQELSAYETLRQKVSEGKISNEEYVRSIDAIKGRISDLKAEAKDVGLRSDEELAKLNVSSVVNGRLVNEGDETVVNSLIQQYNVLMGQIGALEGLMKDMEADWDRIHGKKVTDQQKETEEINKTTQAEAELNNESSKSPDGFRKQWRDVTEMHSKVRELTKELQTYESEYDKMAEKPGFDAQSKKAQELLEKINELRNKISETKSEMSATSGAGSFFGKLKNQMEDFITGNGKFQQSLGDMKTAVSGLIGPFSGATKGVITFTKALWSMAATPIGAVIAAIVLGLKAIHTWMTKDAEGQRALAKITAYVGSLLSSLGDIAVKIGKYLYHAFTDPMGPLNQFGKGLIGMVVNPLKAVGNTLSGVGQIAKGVYDLIASGANVMEAKRAASEIANGWESLKKAAGNVADTLVSTWDFVAGSITGTTKLLGEGVKQGWMTDLNSLGSDILGKAAKAAELAGSELDAQKAISEAKVREKELDIEIAREREKIYTLTGRAKDEQIELVKNKLKEKYDGQIAAQKELLRITKERNNLHTKSLESFAKEREAQGAVYALEAQRAASTRMLVRMQQANLRSIENSDKRNDRKNQQIEEAETKFNEVVRKNVINRAKAESDIEQKVADAKIEAMREGAKKVSAERERAFEKELIQIEEQRRAAVEAERERQKAEFEAQERVIKARGGKAEQWDDTKIDMTAIKSINDKFEAMRKLSVLKYEKLEEDAADNLIKSHQSYVDRKLEIDEEYLNSVTAIDKAIEEAEKRGDTKRIEALERTRIEVAKDRANKQAALSLDELKKSPEYIRAFEDLGNTSTETLNLLINAFERSKKAAADSLDPEKLREYTRTLQDMYDELNSRNPFESFILYAKQLKDAQSELAVAENRLERVRKGEFIIKSVSYDKNSKQAVIQKWDEASAAKEVAAAKDKEAQAYNRVLKAVNACSQQIMQFGSTIEELGNQIGGSMGSILGAFGGIASSIGNVMGSIQNINVNATGLTAALQKVNAVGTAISAMVDMNMKLDSLLPDSHSMYEHYAKKQREINLMQQRIIELQIDQLEDRLNKEHWIYQNGLTNLKKGAELNREYLIAYGRVASQPQEIYQNAGSGFAKWAPAIFGAIVGIIGGVLTFGAGTGAFAALGATIGSTVGGTVIGAALGSTVIAAIGTAIFSGVGAALGNAIRAGLDTITYEEGQTAAINNLRVQTRHKTFFRSEKTQDLESWVREKWGEELFEDVKGVKLIDPEVAKKILEDGPTLVGETRETLEKLLEYSEKIHEFLDQVHEYVSEAFSPLNDNLVDALWDFYANGVDVMDSFREYAQDTFRKIAKDAIKSMAGKLIFEQFQEQLENLTTAYGTGQIDETQYLLGVSAFSTQAQELIEKNLPTLENAIAVIKKAFEASGIDIVGGSGTTDKQSTYNSLEKWSYEQADELINRATALQIIDENQYQVLSQSLEIAYSTLTGVENIRTIVQDIASAIAITIELQEAANSKLDRIILNTNPIGEIRDLVKKLYNER